MPLSLELDDSVRQQLERRAERSEFDSLEEYIAFVLRQVATPEPEIESVDVDIDREDEVRNRLESLGYLE